MAAMLTRRTFRCRELSTPPLRRGRAAHNQPMTASDSPGADLGRFLTVADVAEVLNVSVSQAYALVRSSELPAIKVGGSGHWRVERSVLESYIADKYEENRRRAVWNEAEFADLPELFDRGR